MCKGPEATGVFGKEQKPGGGDWEGYTDAGGSLAYRRKPSMQIVLLRSLWIPKAPSTTTPISSPCWEPAWNLFLVLKGIPLQGDSVILRAQSVQPLNGLCLPQTQSGRSGQHTYIPFLSARARGLGGVGLLPSQAFSHQNWTPPATSLPHPSQTDPGHLVQVSLKSFLPLSRPQASTGRKTSLLFFFPSFTFPKLTTLSYV